MHQERVSRHHGLLGMETPDRYREYAAECFRLASKAKTEADQKTLRQLAQAWEEVAEAAEAES